MTITGSGFVDVDGLACKFGSQVVSAAFLNNSTITCAAPVMLDPGTTTVRL